MVITAILEIKPNSMKILLLIVVLPILPM
jgi:hypothetical protein